MVLWLTTNLMMGIPVDETCNGAASDMNMIVDSMTKLMSLNSPEYRKVREEAVERAMGIIRAERPEMFDPYQYQENKDAETLMKAVDCCEEDWLKLVMLLSFCCTLRIGEILGLTWDCTDISEEAIREESASVYVEKELQRVSKDSLEALSSKDVILVFPETSSMTRTVRVLKKPKTDSSIRRVFLPDTVAKSMKP